MMLRRGKGMTFNGERKVMRKRREEGEAERREKDEWRREEV